MDPKDRLIVALDVDKEEKALGIVLRLKNDVRFFKVGFELFSSCGPDIVKKIKSAGGEVFLDLKFHDIPNTVSKAAAVVTRYGVFMFNVHAAGGYDMMNSAAEAAKKEARSLKIKPPKIIAVTVLTSMDENGLKKTGINDNIEVQVLRLAGMAKDSGLDGVVASPKEAKLIRSSLGEGFLIVSPGVRPAGAGSDDQKRIATPQDAVKSGADFIVVGRPITEAKDPLSAARQILKEIKNA